MDYQRIYNNIVTTAKSRSNCDGYYEKHHIIPRCMGGSDAQDNIVSLTFKEHFLCHRLLCRIYPDNIKLRSAFSKMIMMNGKVSGRADYITSRHFEIVKSYLAPYKGHWNKGKTPWNKGLRGAAYKQFFSEGALTPPSMRGRRWINNSVIQKKIYETETLPVGWNYGRLDMSGDYNPMRKKKVNIDAIQG